jgi:hypothetical protein
MLPAGETLAFRYRIVVHDGMWSPSQCATATTFTLRLR